MGLMINVQARGDIGYRDEKLTRDRRDVAVAKQHVVILPVPDGINLDNCGTW